MQRFKQFSWGGVFMGWCVLAGLLAAAPGAHAALSIAEGSNTIVSSKVALHAADEPMLQINLENETGQPAARLTALTLTAAGTGDDAGDINSVELWWDKDGDGRLTTTGSTPDTLLDQATFNADNGQAAFSGFTVDLATGTQTDLLVIYQFAAGATAGETFRARVAADGDLTVVNASTLAPLSVSGAPVEGFERTVGGGTLTFVRTVQTPDGGVAIPNRTYLPVIHLQALADDVEDLEIDTLSFVDKGSAHGVDGVVPGSVRLYQQTAAPKSTDTPLLAGSFAADNGAATLTTSSLVTVPRGGSVDLWLSLDVVDAVSETIGHTYIVQLDSASALGAQGQMSGLTPTIIGALALGPTWTFNYNPLTFALSSDLGEALMPANGLNYPLWSFTIQNDTLVKSEAVEVRRLTVHASGTVNDATAVSAVKLYLDNSPRGKYTTDDQLLATGTFTVDNGYATLDLGENAQTIGLGSKGYYLVAADLNGTATDGQTMRLSIQTRDDMEIVGAVSQVNGSLVPAPFTGNIKTVGRPRAQLTLTTNLKYIPTVVAPEAAMFPLLGFEVYNQNDENLLLKGLNLDFTGTQDETALMGTMYLCYDKDGDGLYEPVNGETILTSGPLTAAAGQDATLTLSATDEKAYLLELGKRAKFTLFTDVASSVLGDGSEVFTIVADANEDVIAVGAQSGVQADYTTTAPPFELERTIRNPVIEVTHYPSPTEVTGNINGSYGFAGVYFTVPSGEDLLIERVRFQVSGTLYDPGFIHDAYVWNDSNKDLYISDSEAIRPFGYRYWEDPVSSDNGTGQIELDPAGPIERTDTFELSVGLDFDAQDVSQAQAQLARTISVRMEGTQIIEGVGVRSGRPIEVINASPGSEQLGRTMTFDKGTCEVTQRPIERTSAPPFANNAECFELQLKTDRIEHVRVDQLVLHMIGTLDESKYIREHGIKIFIDENRNGKIDGDDYLTAWAEPPTTDNGAVTFVEGDYFGLGNVVYTYPPSGYPYDTYLFCVDLTDDAPEGATIQFELSDVDDLDLSGYGSKFPFDLGDELSYPGGNPPLTGPEILIQRGAVEFKVSTSFQSDTDNQPNVRMAPLAEDYEVARFTIKATAAEEVRLEGLTIRVAGTASVTDDLWSTPSANLYKGKPSTSTYLTSGTFTADGALVLSNFAQELVVSSKTSADLYLTFNGNGHATMGTGLDLSVSGADLQAVGLSSGLAITTMQPADPCLAIPVEFGPGRLTIRADNNDAYILPLWTGEDTILQKLIFTASRTEGLRLEDLTVSNSGTADEPATFEGNALRLNYRNSSEFSTLGSAPILPGDDGQAALRDLDLVIEADKNTSTRYSLDGILSDSGAVSGATVRLDLLSTGTQTVRAVGLLTGQPVEIVLQNYNNSLSDDDATSIPGAVITLSNGMVTLAKGSKNPKDAQIEGDEQMLPLMQFNLRVKGGLEAVSLERLEVLQVGSMDESLDVGTLYLYKDTDNNGLVGEQDILISTASFAAAGEKAVFDNLQLTYAEDATVNWLIAADLTGQAALGTDLKLSLCDGEPSLYGAGQLTEGPINVVLANNAPAGTLYSMPLPRPYVTLTGDAVARENQGFAQVTIQLDRASDQTVDVTFQTINKTATAGQDYVGRNETVSLLAGQSQTVIQIELIDDGVQEPVESFLVRIIDLDNANWGDKTQVTVSISDQQIPRIVPYLLGLTQDASGLDMNGDGNIDISDHLYGFGQVYPQTPSTPDPADWGSKVFVDGRLDWDNSPRAQSYELYLWPAGQAQPDQPLVSNLTASNYTPSTPLAYATHYQWKIIAYNSDGWNPGPVWNFTTEDILWVVAPSGPVTWAVGTEQWVQWRCNKDVTGTSARLELWRDGQLAATLDNVYTSTGESSNAITVPQVEPGDNYQLRLVSYWLEEHDEPGASVIADTTITIQAP